MTMFIGHRDDENRRATRMTRSVGQGDEVDRPRGWGHKDDEVRRIMY
jgi:hypothetical protein